MMQNLHPPGYLAGRRAALDGFDAITAGCNPNDETFPSWCNGWSSVLGVAAFTMIEGGKLAVTPNYLLTPFQHVAVQNYKVDTAPRKPRTPPQPPKPPGFLRVVEGARA